jgi:phage-related protein
LELFKLFGTIALNGVDETHSALDGITNKASGIGSKIASGVGSVAKTVGTAAVGAVAATTTAVAAIGKAAVSSYAEYEQLVGGVDTLFKESSQKVQDYADNAYKTAGMSANAYMDTVTSFSASLLQGLGGDTEAAAEMANTAITDMSDNANKMGTDMASIQNAYQGFAKKNYTMLDNLKLGYGGTASEMARLVNESGVLGDSITVTAETVNNVSFDKIIEAIHVVQEEMGIAGTTAKEAATTISGSLSSVKASWSNLLTGMSSDDADISQLVGNLTDSIETAASNLLPRITETIGGIGEAAVQLAPVFAESISKLVTDVAPDLLQAGIELADALLTSFANSLSDISPILAPIGQMILEVKESISNIFSTLGDSINWDTLFSGMQTALEVVCELVTTVVGGLEDLVAYATTEGTPLNDFFLNLKETASQVVTWFKENWGSIGETFDGLKEKLGGACEKLVEAFNTVLAAINENNGISDALTWLKTNVFDPLVETFSALVDAGASVAQIISDVIAAIITAAQSDETLIGKVVKWIGEDLKIAFDLVKESAELLANFLNGDMEAAMENIKNIGEDVGKAWEETFNLVKGILEEIVELFENNFNEGIDKANGLFNTVQLNQEDMTLLGDLGVSQTVNRPDFTDGMGSGASWLTDGMTSKGNTKGTATKGSAKKNTTEFYASGAVLTEPTAFGLNPYTGKTMIGGESGAEAIAPIDTLQGYVSEAVEAKTSGMNDTLNRILDALVVMNDNMGANMREAMEGVSLRMNNRELARAVKGVV